MTIIQTFKNAGKVISVYGTFDQPLFLAKEIGDILGFKCIRSTLRVMKPSWKVVRAMHTRGGDQKMTFLTEPGFYKLIMKSNKKEALDFQTWICEDVIPSIRKRGHYELDNQPIRKKLCFKIENEFDLHTKLVNFIQNYYPSALIVATLGETRIQLLKGSNLNNVVIKKVLLI